MEDNSIGIQQDRTGQDRTAQDRTGQNRTGQDRTGQDSREERQRKETVSVIKSTIMCHHPVSLLLRHQSLHIANMLLWRTVYLYLYLESKI